MKEKVLSREKLIEKFDRSSLGVIIHEDTDGEKTIKLSIIIDLKKDQNYYHIDYSFVGGGSQKNFEKLDQALELYNDAIMNHMYK